MKSRENFSKAIQSAEHLKLKPGLQAIKAAEGRGKIFASDNHKILGSVDIDGDCTSAFPQACRWDYVVGFERGQKPIAFFIEVHSADTCDVSRVEKKLEWLLEFLRSNPQADLNAFQRHIYWVASGRVKIPKHTPQFRRLNSSLRKRGLLGPITELELT